MLINRLDILDFVNGDSWGHLIELKVYLSLGVFLDWSVFLIVCWLIGIKWACLWIWGLTHGIKGTKGKRRKIKKWKKPILLLANNF